MAYFDALSRKFLLVQCFGFHSTVFAVHLGYHQRRKNTGVVLLVRIRRIAARRNANARAPRRGYRFAAERRCVNHGPAVTTVEDTDSRARGRGLAEQAGNGVVADVLIIRGN